MCACISVSICLCLSIYAYVCAYIYIYIYIVKYPRTTVLCSACTCMDAYVHMYMNANMYTNCCTHMYVKILVYVHAYSYTYIHTHAYSPVRRPLLEYISFSPGIFCSSVFLMVLYTFCCGKRCWHLYTYVHAYMSTNTHLGV